MKSTRLVWLILISGFFFLVSCDFLNVKPNCGDPPYTGIDLLLVDARDSLVIGKKYNPDSIRLSVKDVPIEMAVQNGVIHLNYSYFTQYNDENFILYLSKADQDTLNFIINKYNNGECGTVLSVGSFHYNKALLSPDPNGNNYTYRVVK
jgi:hypothetical protein